MTQGKLSTRPMPTLTEVKQREEGDERSTSAVASVRRCCQSLVHGGLKVQPRKIYSVEQETMVEANSRPHDNAIYTDSSITENQTGRGFTVQQNERIMHNDRSTCRVQSHRLHFDDESRRRHASRAVALTGLQPPKATVTTAGPLPWPLWSQWSTETSKQSGSHGAAGLWC